MNSLKMYFTLPERRSPRPISNSIVAEVEVLQ
jgi:hypothetical protein